MQRGCLRQAERSKANGEKPHPADGDAAPPSRARVLSLPVARRLWIYCMRSLPLMWHDADPKEVCSKFVDTFK